MSHTKQSKMMRFLILQDLEWTLSVPQMLDDFQDDLNAEIGHPRKFKAAGLLARVEVWARQSEVSERYSGTRRRPMFFFANVFLASCCAT